jgi:phosphomannomutase
VVTLRGSGTEPKLKYYAELPSTGFSSRDETIQTLRSIVQSIIDEYLQPQENGLVPPSD